MAKSLNKLLKILLVLIIIYLFFEVFFYIDKAVKFIISLTIPFIIAFTISFMLQPIIKYLEKRGIKKRLAASLTLFCLLLIIVSFFIFIGPIISKEFMIFIEMIPKYIDALNNFINNFEKKYYFLNKLGIDFNNLFSLFELYGGNIFQSIIDFVESIFSYFVPIILIPILIVYFVYSYDELEDYIKKTTKNNITLYAILKQSKNALKTYLTSYFLIIVILSIVASLIFGLIGLDYYIIWGVLIGITDIIPYIGPYIGGAIVLLFVLSSKPELFFFVFIIICLLQLLEACILTPKIQGKAMKINPIVVIFSITLFGEVLGIFGMLIAVPITTILKIIIEEVKKTKNVKKNI